jgi:hypothetical protein
MKKILLLLFLATSTLSASTQKADNCLELTKLTLPTSTEGNIEYTSVLEASDKKQQELYTAVRSWYATNFSYVQDGEVLNDTANGKLVVNGIKDYKDFNAHYTLDFTFKDGKFRTIVKNIIVVIPDVERFKRDIRIPIEEFIEIGMPLGKNNRCDFVIRLDSHIKNLIKNVEASATKKSDDF